MGTEALEENFPGLVVGRTGVLIPVVCGIGGGVKPAIGGAIDRCDLGRDVSFFRGASLMPGGRVDTGLPSPTVESEPAV